MKGSKVPKDPKKDAQQPSAPAQTPPSTTQAQPNVAADTKDVSKTPKKEQVEEQRPIRSTYDQGASGITG